MKKVLIVCIALLFAVPAFSEVYYKISKSDFQALKSCMLRIQDYFLENGAENGYCWGWDVYGINDYLLKSIEDNVEKDTESIYPKDLQELQDLADRMPTTYSIRMQLQSFINKQSEKIKQYSLNDSQKISRLEDEITLLKMELNKYKIQLDRFMKIK